MRRGADVRRGAGWRENAGRLLFDESSILFFRKRVQLLILIGHLDPWKAEQSVRNPAPREAVALTAQQFIMEK